jgi:hypothetical protein
MKKLLQSHCTLSNVMDVGSPNDLDDQIVPVGEAKPGSPGAHGNYKLLIAVKNDDRSPLYLSPRTYSPHINGEIPVDAKLASDMLQIVNGHSHG